MSWRNKAVFLAALIFSVALLVTPVASSPTPPVAAFTYTPAAPIFHQAVIFNASESYDPDGKNITSYMWDFGDETVKSIPNPVTYHNYTALGTYNVTLTVTDGDGETATTWQSVTVRDYPVAVFTYTPELPIAGYPVTFNASLSTPEGGEIANYTWDFGDENVTTVTSPVINHVYTTPENYTVTLNVTDSEGLWDTESELITVRGIPVAVFTCTPERPIRNEPVTFNASLSTSDGGTIVSYFWNFGDGTNGTGMILNHTYTTIGSYTANLTITDSENLTDIAQATFTVRDYPVALFEYTPSLPLVNETVRFDASDSTADGGNIMNYTWDFGDDSSPVTETDPETNHVYTAFGTYNVSLTITDSEDLTDTFSDTIRIAIIPVASFTYSPTKPLYNETVTFNASASYDPDRSIVSYDWDFGDQTTGTGMVVTHAYATEGTYNVTLMVTDDDDLDDTMWKMVTVYTEIPVHDIAITSVTTSATEVYVGLTVNVSVVVKNEGTEVESFSVTVYYDSTGAGTKTVSILLPNSTTNLTFSWNTAGVTPCRNYTISANAAITTPGVDADDDPADNVREDGKVKVRLVGDADGVGGITILDVGKVAMTFATSGYDVMHDMDGDCDVDIIDLGKTAMQFALGTGCP